MPAGPASDARPGLLRRWWNRLPDRVDRRVVIAAWATLVVQIGIVGTGGLVRLTGSGLGCPTWPSCTADSLVPTPETAGHGLIEFGNRLLTFVLVLVAILTFLSVVRMRRTRKDLFWLALGIGLYVPVQGILGGLTVLSGLNPYVVGLHFVASAALVALSAAFVVRVYATPGPRTPAGPAWYRLTAWVTTIATAVALLLGVLVTGSGPHAGDGGAARNGLDPELMQHIHAWPAYLALAGAVVLAAGAGSIPRSTRMRRWTALLLVALALQIVVGLWQARSGLPIVLVNIHMVVSMLIVAAMTVVDMNMSVPTRTAAADLPRQRRKAMSGR